MFCFIKFKSAFRDPLWCESKALRYDVPMMNEPQLTPDAKEDRLSAEIEALLKVQNPRLTPLEDEVVKSVRHNRLVSKNLEQEASKNTSFGDRVSDRLAQFGGSWTFLISFFVFLTIWILINSVVVLWHPVDPYPFILLNLLMSGLASIQAPVILMSQNRQEKKDREHAQHDYQVNLKAELEIRYLHQKIDDLMDNHWQKLLQIQKVQLDLLQEIRSKKDL